MTTTTQTETQTQAQADAQADAELGIFSDGARAVAIDALTALGALAASTGAVSLEDALDAVEDGYAEHQEVTPATE